MSDTFLYSSFATKIPHVAWNYFKHYFSNYYYEETIKTLTSHISNYTLVLVICLLSSYRRNFQLT
jgi:hypothetical protein